MKIISFPILKLLIPYVLGIFCAYFIHFPYKILYFCIVFIIIFLVNSAIFNVKIGYYRQKIANISLLSVLFLLGFLSTFLSFHDKFNQSVIAFNSENRYWQIQITDNPIIREKTVKVVASLRDNEKSKNIHGKAVLYFQADSLAKQLQYGDKLIIQAQLSWIGAPKNPQEFDYKSFMKRKGIYFSGYIPAHSWQILSKDRFSIKRISSSLQKKFSTIFATAGLTGEEYSIATAILLGNDETMEGDLKNSYASAGVSHILCVSGMHVGIIFMILNYLLMPLDLFPKIRWLKSLVLFLAIWLYANITGLSPSVMRAATMFSFVLIGEHLRRNTNVFHSLFASLFILLIINPLLIFELGFQLSYLAVIGIVVLQKPIFSIWKVKTKIGIYFWNLASVSIAAQLVTFPLTIYYFGVFPNYFLLANLSVIMLSFVIVISGVVVLFFSFSSVLNIWLGKILSFEIKAMNYIIRFIENLPGSVSENISINVFQALALYAAIICFFLFFKRKNFLSFCGGFIALFLTFLINSLDRIKDSKQENIVVYAISKSTVVGFYSQGQGLILSDSAFSMQNKSYQFSVKNHERNERICSEFFDLTKNYQTDKFLKINNFIKFKDKIVYIHSGKEKLYPATEQICVDYLLVTNNAKQHLDDLSKALSCKMIIIDESNSPYYEQLWLKAAEDAQLPVYSLRQSGFAFQVNVPSASQ